MSFKNFRMPTLQIVRDNFHLAERAGTLQGAVMGAKLMRFQCWDQAERSRPRDQARSLERKIRKILLHNSIYISSRNFSSRYLMKYMSLIALKLIEKCSYGILGVWRLETT